MSTTTTTITDLLNKYNISLAQLVKATRKVDPISKEVYYEVASQTTEGVIYKVTWNKQFSRLACDCLAGHEGSGCWHRRAALARNEERRVLQLEAQRAEQAEVEQTPEYQREQLEHSIEVAAHQLQRIA